MHETSNQQPNQIGDGSSYIDWLDQVWAQRLSHEGRAEKALTVGILLWPSFPLMSLTGIIESLRHAGDFGDHSEQRYVHWEIIGQPGALTRSSCSIPVAATHDYVFPGDLDYLFVIGGLLRDIDKGPATHRAYLRAARKVGCPIVGVCTGSFVLAQEAMLDRHTACIHPYHKADYQLAFPAHRLTTVSDFTQHDRLTTVPGGISILSFMTKIIGDHFGPDRSAKTVFQLSLSDRAAIGTLEKVGLNRHLTVNDPRVQKALVVLESQATQSPNIALLAASLSITERHLHRLFTAQVGISPQSYLIDMKLKAAVWMLQNTSKSVTSVAYAAGFSSASNLAVHSVKRLKATPTHIRG